MIDVTIDILVEGAGSFWNPENEPLEYPMPMRETFLDEAPDAPRSVPDSDDHEDDDHERCEECDRCIGCGDCTCDN